jgi:hypothetical protein
MSESPVPSLSTRFKESGKNRFRLQTVLIVIGIPAEVDDGPLLKILSCLFEECETDFITRLTASS